MLGPPGHWLPPRLKDTLERAAYIYVYVQGFDRNQPLLDPPPNVCLKYPVFENRQPLQRLVTSNIFPVVPHLPARYKRPRDSDPPFSSYSAIGSFSVVDVDPSSAFPGAPHVEGSSRSDNQ